MLCTHMGERLNGWFGTHCETWKGRWVGNLVQGVLQSLGQKLLLESWGCWGAFGQSYWKECRGLRACSLSTLRTVLSRAPCPLHCVCVRHAGPSFSSSPDSCTYGSWEQESDTGRCQSIPPPSRTIIGAIYVSALDSGYCHGWGRVLGSLLTMVWGVSDGKWFFRRNIYM